MIVAQVFSTVEAVLDGVEYMVAKQLSRDPTLRKYFRQEYRKRCMLSITPTQTGIIEIDENHPLYYCKYLLNKPVHRLTNDEFIKIVQVSQSA